MDNRTFYYARVSSKDQNLDRQLAAFKALSADERDIITDKESGKDFNRAGYQALKNGMLRQGDTLVIKSLDRLSRNKRDIKTELEWFKKWKEIRLKWHKALGFGDGSYRYHDHDKLAHYANAATDIEFLMPFGFKEVEGIHSRTNFDLSQHEKFSGKSIKYFDPELNESYTPYVIETSIGVDRMFLSIMSASYCEEQLENGESRVVLKLPAALAPVKLAVMPLVKKDGLPEKAREVIDSLKFHFHCQYDEKDSIGKRYRRQDAIGTPYCVTVDHQTLEDNCVTLRNRDTMQQERVAISELNNIIADRVSITSLLKTLQ